MSELEHGRKVIRKRKTRTERNQMSRHHLQDHKRQKKHAANLKDTESNLNTTYTLRSTRNSHSSFLPFDNKKTTSGGTITQGRLTRSLGKLTFTNSKTSDWIKRGPIIESDAMKEKVENDIKRILWLAERSTLSAATDLLPGTDNTSHGINTTVELEPHTTEMECSASNGTTTVSKITTDKSQQPQSQNASSQQITAAATTTTVTSVELQTPVTPEKTGNSSGWATTALIIVDETLQLEPPVQEIADKILKELRPKFARLFPNRDIEMEICSDLQKLLNHSSCYSEEIEVNHPVDTLQPHECIIIPTGNVNANNMCTPVLSIPSCSASTLTVCRPLNFQTGHFYTQPQHFEHDSRLDTNGSAQIQDSAHYPYSSTSHEKDGAAQSFLAAFVVPGDNEVDDIKINVTVDDNEDDDNDALSAARYNAFLVSARELEVEQEKRFRHRAKFGELDPSQTNAYHSCLEQDQFMLNPSGLKSGLASVNVAKDINPNSNAHSFDWRNIRAARILDFSQPSGSHQNRATTFYSCPYKNVCDNTYSNVHLVHPSVTHCRSKFDYLLKNTSEPSKSVFSSQGYSPASRLTFDLGKSFPCPETHLNSLSNFMKRNTTSNVGQHLAQSRQNFHNALKFASRTNDICSVKPVEEIDADRCDDLILSIPTKGSSIESCNVLGCQHLMSKPLSELQSHQADLQHQARDFLDDLDRCGAKSQLDFMNCQPNHSRHLFRLPSPDSNGSPVWGILPVLKDFG